jgi:CheY-like chemotaxis protein
MELLALMGHAVDALDQLLGSLLDISRLDAGVIDTRVEPVPLQALIDSLLGEVRPLAWDKGLQLRTRRGEHMILSDPGLLTNILRNLLTNAIRYTEQGGVLIACRRRGKNLLLQVWDSGIGIDATDHQQIFQEFTQLNNPERDRNKGLGLGLAICRRMSVLLGHPLSVRSMPRRGTVFSIEVPLYDGTVLPTAEGATAPVQRDLRGLRVLVLEDDETVRLGMVALLEHWGCRVLAAASVEMALQMARQAAFQIDAMVSDYRLPGDTTGVEAMAAIMQEARGTIPVVLITGDTSPQRIQEAKLSGFPLLHKPVKPAFLRNALGRAMQAVE